MHEWIRAAFAEMKVATELSPGARKEAPGQCFVGAEQYDVLLGGRKLAGAAQRRTKTGLLIQGSIQPPAGMRCSPQSLAASPPPPAAGGEGRGEEARQHVPLARIRFESAMLNVASRFEGVTWAELCPDATLTDRVRELAESKYSRVEFNRRR